MQENVGKIDRWVRVVVGGGLAWVGLQRMGRESLGAVACVTVGALLLESALTRVCPLNALLGVDTRELDARAGARGGANHPGRELPGTPVFVVPRPRAGVA